MGMTIVRTTIKNPEKPSMSIEEDFLVDSGAVYSVVPEDKLLKLGIKPHRKQNFVLADGTKISREIGDAIFEIEGLRGAAPIVFGKKGEKK